MRNDDRKEVFFRTDPEIYAGFAEHLRKQSNKATVNVGAALTQYMAWVAGRGSKPNILADKDLGEVLHAAPESSVYNIPCVVASAAEDVVKAAKALEAAIATTGVLSEPEISEGGRNANQEVKDLTGRIEDAEEQLSRDEEGDGPIQRSGDR